MIAALQSRRDGAVQKLVLAASYGALMVATAWLFPLLLPALVLSCLAVGGLVLAYQHLTAAWVGWILIAGLSLEMAMSDLAGPEAFQATITAVKGTEIGLVALMIARFGPVVDWLNPALAFLAMGGMGLVAGLHPELPISDMLRSLVGSITPFLVFFCAKPSGWSRAVLRAIPWAPVLSVALGSVPHVFGWRSMLMESGGVRLAGLGHPAFLAGVCLPAVYAGLLEWLRTASPRAAALIGVNLIILFLTGARAPAAYCAVVMGGSLLIAPNSAVPRAHRLALFAVGCAAVPVLMFVGETYSSLRLFEVLSGEAGHLSGRDLLWPYFEAAAARAPWFGWGLGAGNLVIPHDGQIAQLLHTWAAHNEYLRLEVEGGQIGRALLIVLFVAWVVTHTKQLAPRERVVLRLIFLTYAAHAVTDNVLISTPACVFYAFVAAVFAAADDPPTKCLRDAGHVA
jgi:hypothetical protein